MDREIRFFFSSTSSTFTFTTSPTARASEGCLRNFSLIGEDKVPGGERGIQHAAGPVQQYPLRPQGQHLLHQRRRGRSADDGLHHPQLPSVVDKGIHRDVPPAAQDSGRPGLPALLQRLEGFFLKGEHHRLRKAGHWADHVGGLQNLLGNRVEGVE